MKIQWLGHASFLITSESGKRIVTDPYEPGSYDGALKYRPLNQPVDIITVSHEHPDHFYPGMVSGNPMLIKGAGRFVADGIDFTGIATHHDEAEGEKRGRNTIFTFTIDGIKICHLGDLGHVLTGDQAAEAGAVDVLLTPVGGYFTIDAEEAWKVADQVAAKIVIPMHFRTPSVDFPIAGVEEFLKGKENVVRLDSSTLEITKDDLPQERQIVVLKHAL